MMAKLQSSKEINNIPDKKLGLRDGDNLCTEKSSKQRLLVVANRLPVSAVRKGTENAWNLEVSAGGLVSALMGVKEFEAIWIGWAGVNVPDEVGQSTLTTVLAEKKCIPIFLDEEIISQYYNGYCNNILWPLFHYLGFPQEDGQLATTRSFQSQFNAYKKANQMFADVVNKHYQKGDIVWCHDYHLMLLPKYLKEYNSSMKVGWFLHTPFPSSEIYRTLSSRSELLRAVLAADLVGFHTNDYARNFVSACTGILGLRSTPDGVEDQGKLTRVSAFPIGIDSDRFIRALELSEVKECIEELRKIFSDRKVILGVDRLDMIKGIPQKLLAFEKFLETNPYWRNVVLVQIAIPTRTDVQEYQKLTCQVHEIVGRVNGKFGILAACPIHYLDQSIDFHVLCALYAVADVALVTSLRDGMNLVSYEFVTCQASNCMKGVLVLSEFAGAAQFLGVGAILVNPWNVSEVAVSIDNALNMSFDERVKRHHHNFMHVTTHTSQKWADTFVSKLNNIVVEVDQLRIKHILPMLPVNIAKKRYATSKNRLLILGFNSTLTDPLNAPKIRGDQLIEMKLKLHPELKDPLLKLCHDPNAIIVVLTGSDRSSLDKNFGEYNMWLAAENGMLLRHTMEDWMTTMPKNLNMDWIDSVKDVFEYFTEKTPKSYIELRETSLVWNYKYADVEFGNLQARDMIKHLSTSSISNAAVDVIQGERSVEVRAVGFTKGAAIDRILREIIKKKKMLMPIDYVLCVGHFLPKDEDIYTFFEPELPYDTTVATRQGISKTLGAKAIKILKQKFGSKISQNANRPVSSLEEKVSNVGNAPHWEPASSFDKMTLPGGSSAFDLPGDNYFSCAVVRKSSKAKYLLGSSTEVVMLLKELSQCIT